MIVVWLAHLFSFQKIHTFIGLSVITISGADKGTNRANCDTSTKFGTNVLWGQLVKSARGAT